MRILAWLTTAFPFWVLGASLLALYHPPLFTWFRGPLITLALGIIMLGMGVTLELADFKRVGRYKRLVVIGVVLQFTVMPSLGWAIGYMLDLPTPFAVGLILVASCPGGTASNVIAFLARADVPLSVTMTAVSTLAAVIMTPVLTSLLASSRVDVPAVGLLVSTIQVVIVPVVAGVALNHYVPTLTRRILPVAPLVAVVMITMIVASIIGAGRDEIVGAAIPLLAGVAALHLGGFALGYAASLLLVGEHIPARTISIEVGMQNSGLGVVLARQNFSSPLVAIPSAISSLFHSLIGSLVATIWRHAVERSERKR